jgi:hypothetical protein
VRVKNGMRKRRRKTGRRSKGDVDRKGV